MKEKKSITHRSNDPVSYTLDFIGDKWTLLVLRDMIFADKKSYGEFLQSEEKIATNILADRLNMLQSNGFIDKAESPDNKSKFLYSLTEKGISLLPIIIEMSLWGSLNNPNDEHSELAELLRKNKEKTIKDFSKVLKKRNGA